MPPASWGLNITFTIASVLRTTPEAFSLLNSGHLIFRIEHALVLCVALILEHTMQAQQLVYPVAGTTRAVGAGHRFFLELRLFLGLLMKMTERIRQAVTGPLDLDRIRSYEKEGWKLASLEWERQVDSKEAPIQMQEEPPFGTRVSANAAILESDPSETDVLFAMMELIVEDGPYYRIAEELNRRGYRTRSGSRWSPVSVFEMLPRLIDAGPKIFNTDRWHSRRSQEPQPK